MIINTPIEELSGTSTITKRRLKNIGINTYWDLINYFPFRYEDYSLVSPINRLQAGEKVTIKGKITAAKFEITKKGTKMQRFTLEDNSGKINLIWFNQPYLLRIIKINQYISVSGTVNWFVNKISLFPEQYELINSLVDQTIHTARIIPIYPEKNGLSTKILRDKIFRIINQLTILTEILPKEIISYNNLNNRLTAYQNIHFPQNEDVAFQARKRLAFDELFMIQLSVALTKSAWKKEIVGSVFNVETCHGMSLHEFINNLPFKLTAAQHRVTQEIITDLQKKQPMNRFLQGDVGSGKTVVATIACYLAYLNKLQSLFMAPTEILANQHYQTITNLIKDLPIKIGIQTKSKKIINPKKYDVIVGTHALLNQKLQFKRVGLVVVDEQHRFGVSQRALLKEKGVNPHLLSMTATPIPRTIALTLYGALDLSVIDEMPKGRMAVKTYLVPKEKRNAGYAWIKNKIIKEKIQVFIICPLIEESSVETMQSVKAAKKEFTYLQNEIFPRFKLGLIHGKLKSTEKEKLMNDFQDNKIHILVSTSLVEVGIDIPNATIMLIEGADRFGLAQLHQLRGRIGRGDKQAYCFLFTENNNEKVLKRLQYFSKHFNGNEIAEYDLRIRGPGEIFGTRQHGYINLKIASLSDFDLIKKSHNAVTYFIQNYPDINQLPAIKSLLSTYQTQNITQD